MAPCASSAHMAAGKTKTDSGMYCAILPRLVVIGSLQSRVGECALPPQGIGETCQVISGARKICPDYWSDRCSTGILAPAPSCAPLLFLPEYTAPVVASKYVKPKIAQCVPKSAEEVSEGHIEGIRASGASDSGVRSVLWNDKWRPISPPSGDPA
jgi:hypothetical protein